ncbi:MAG: sodium:proton antiporter [Desulfuromonas sp.]|nr:sodium:proton antiporter [Desulfuromonas sp.]
MVEQLSIDQLVALFAGIFVIGSLCQWLAWWVKLPAIIFLLLTGILVGPVFNLVAPDQLIGPLLFPFISLSVAVILFEGSLTLRYKEIIGMQKVVRNMTSIGMLVTWAITTVATHIALPLSWELCLLFGAISVVTGPTVIAPMLRTVRPTQSVSNILRWEGIVIDPIGASLAVLVYEFIIAGGGQGAFGHTMVNLARIVLIGFSVGAVGGYAFGLALRKHLLPEFLHNIGALALVFGTFALSNMLQPESGLVTVTVMGVWLANMPGVDMEDILDFKESLSILLISLLFIVLAARLEFSSMQQIGWPVLWVFLAIQFLARPLNIMVSTLGSTLSWPERHLLAWVAPRGIIAAAVAALFAMQLQKAGIANASMLVPLTFFIIIGTVLLQSFTARPIAIWLGVAEPEPRGCLIIGANTVARAIGAALKNGGFRVLLADSNWDHISAARMDGLATYFGNPISEHADRHLDMVGIGRMLALSPRAELNIGAAMHHRIDLGVNNIFILQTKTALQVSEKHQIVNQRRGHILFGEQVSYSALLHKLGQGWEIHATKLTATFTFEQWRAQHADLAITLFAVDTKHNLRLFCADMQFVPQAGWQLYSLLPPEYCPLPTK